MRHMHYTFVSVLTDMLGQLHAAQNLFVAALTMIVCDLSVFTQQRQIVRAANSMPSLSSMYPACECNSVVLRMTPPNFVPSWGPQLCHLCHNMAGGSTGKSAAAQCSRCVCHRQLRVVNGCVHERHYRARIAIVDITPHSVIPCIPYIYTTYAVHLLCALQGAIKSIRVAHVVDHHQCVCVFVIV